MKHELLLLSAVLALSGSAIGDISNYDIEDGEFGGKKYRVRGPISFHEGTASFVDADTGKRVTLHGYTYYHNKRESFDPNTGSLTPHPEPDWRSLSRQMDAEGKAGK